ncbi:MAG: RluA family pseudouridine synthase [Bdellovibrio sp.]|nr:RluA family pseudouridine synthase [Bdellovibrio sp.]
MILNEESRTPTVLRIDVTNSHSRADLYILSQIQAGSVHWSGAPVVVSRSQLQKLMQMGLVICGGREIRPGDSLRVGTQVVISFPPPDPSELIPEDRPLEVLFEDEYLIVINKPPGLTVHPSSTQKAGTLVHALLYQIKNLSGVGGVLRPGIVHRLDKDTSGALVVSKTDQAHLKLAETFSRHEIDRVYWALAYGTPKLSAGKIESLIGRDPNDRKKMSMKVKQGRRAITHYRVLEKYGCSGKPPFASWMELTLETGRTHQIRVHLNGLGNSVIGDPTYGVPSSKSSKLLALPSSLQTMVSGLSGQLLHARVLGFNHPVSGEKLRFEAAPPAQFSNFHQGLKAYSGKSG